MIKEVKSTLPLETLCKGIPKEFVQFLKYIRELGFTETPNYKYLRRLFRKLFVISGYDFDYRYDWVENKYKKKSKKHSKFEDKKKELKAMAKQLTNNMNKISKVYFKPQEFFSLNRSFRRNKKFNIHLSAAFLLFIHLCLLF